MATKASAELSDLDRRVTRVFDEVRLVGQLHFTEGDFHRLADLLKRTLAGKLDDLDKIPERMLLISMVFCARYADTAEAGYWSIYLRELGFPNESNIQNAFRERFKAAKQRATHMYFPDEGYKCVTPILYHAVIPQTCVPEMARLLRSLGRDPGWDTISELDVAVLEEELPKFPRQSLTSKPLKRFLSDPNSRRYAAKLVRDLCEAVSLYECGDFTKQQIDELLQDQPVQREVWDALLAVDDPQDSLPKLGALLNPPRWQWDLKARQMRLYLPRQRFPLYTRPFCYRMKKQEYPIDAQLKDEFWNVEATCLYNLPIQWLSSDKVTICVYDQLAHRLWRRVLDPPYGGVLLFRPSDGERIGSYSAGPRGISPGEWLVLHKRSVSLLDKMGVIKPVPAADQRALEDYLKNSIGRTSQDALANMERLEKMDNTIARANYDMKHLQANKSEAEENLKIMEEQLKALRDCDTCTQKDREIQALSIQIFQAEQQVEQTNAQMARLRQEITDRTEAIAEREEARLRFGSQVGTLATGWQKLVEAKKQAAEKMKDGQDQSQQ